MVKKSFSKAIVSSKSLSNDKEDLMVVFMLSNIKDIFKVRGSASAHSVPVIRRQFWIFFFLLQVPRALHKDVSEKLASLAEGKPADVMGK